MPFILSLISLGLLGAVAPKLALLLAAVAAGALAAELYRKHLREDRTDVRGVADVLPYGFLVADGTVLNKDGSLSRAILFRGPDGDGETPEEKQVVSEYIGNAIAKMGDGWGFHVDEVRHASQDYPARGAFPDTISRLVDQERRASYEMAGRHYESDFYMVATYLRPRPATASSSRTSRMARPVAKSIGARCWTASTTISGSWWTGSADGSTSRYWIAPPSCGTCTPALPGCITPSACRKTGRT